MDLLWLKLDKTMEKQVTPNVKNLPHELTHWGRDKMDAISQTTGRRQAII